jgi:hypothetical protein
MAKNKKPNEPYAWSTRVFEDLERREDERKSESSETGAIVNISECVRFLRGWLNRRKIHKDATPTAHRTIEQEKKGEDS